MFCDVMTFLCYYDKTRPAKFFTLKFTFFLCYYCDMPLLVCCCCLINAIFWFNCQETKLQT